MGAGKELSLAIQWTMTEENIFILFYFCVTAVYALVTVTVIKHIGRKQLMKEGFILAFQS